MIVEDKAWRTGGMPTLAGGVCGCSRGLGASVSMADGTDGITPGSRCAGAGREARTVLQCARMYLAGGYWGA